MKIDIVIPHLESQELLDKCLLLYKQCCDPAITNVYVIDNGSKIPLKNEIYGSVIRMEENLGMVKSLKKAKEISGAELLIFTHSDMFYYEKGWDKKVVEAFTSDSKLGLLGVVGGRIAKEDGDRVEQIGDFYNGPLAFANIEYAALIDGCSMMFRREALDSFELDEGYYPHHYYDKDWSLEIITHGYKVGVVKLHCEHFRAGANTTCSTSYLEWANNFLKTEEAGGRPEETVLEKGYKNWLADHHAKNKWVRADNEGDTFFYVANQKHYTNKWKKHLPVVANADGSYTTALDKAPLTTKDIQHIESAWKGHEDFAVALVKLLKPNTVVELGVDHGFSTMAFALPGIGTVYGVDHFEGDEHTGPRNTGPLSTYDLLCRDIKNLAIDNIVLIKEDFTRLAKTWNKEIDILHIDGFHAYESVKRDFDNWLDLVKDTGVILFHDTISFPADVGRLFAEIQLPKFNLTHAHGLGIVSKSQKVLDEIVSLIINDGTGSKSVKELFYTNNARISDKWSNYLDLYDSFLQPYEHRPVNLLEIGVQDGGSLGIFSKYFHPGSNIVGVDINPLSKQAEEGNIKIFTGNQADTKFMESLPYQFDIIIDDGSHVQSDVISTFNTMFPLLKNNGIYIVEGAHTAYWSDFGGGLKKAGTFIDHAKNMADEANGFHIRQPYNQVEYGNWIKGVYFTDSVVVIEKRDVAATHAKRVISGDVARRSREEQKKFLILLNYYERPVLLRNALNSIKELQSDNWELAFIDDGSKVKGEPIVRSIFTDRELSKTKFYRCEDTIEQKKAQGGSRHGQYNNEAICNSDADYFIMLCDDDALVPDYFLKLSEVLNATPFPYAYCNIMFFNPEKETYKQAFKEARERFNGSNYYLNYHRPLNPYCTIDASQMICNTACVKNGLVKFPFPQTINLDASVYGQLYKLYGNCMPVNLYGQYKATHPLQLGNRKEVYQTQ